MKRKWLPLSLAVFIFLLVGIYYVFDPEINELNETTRARLGGQYIRLSEGVTHYKLEGSEKGRVVVLVHGGTVPIWVWDKQVSALIKKGFKVLSYDQYGRGYSDRPHVTYDRTLYTNQLLELADKLGLKETFDLIGISMGGAIAVNFTAKYPDRVRKLVLISPVINNFKVPSVLRVPVFGEFMARIIGVRVIVKRFKSLMEGKHESEKYTELFLEQTTYKGFQQSILSMIRNDAVGNYNKAYQNVGKQKRDVLLIWGTDDREITKEMIRDIQTFIPLVIFKPVEGVGHGIVFQKPEEVNKLILSFL